MKQLLASVISIVVFMHTALAGAQEDFFAACMSCNAAGVQKALDAGADVNGLN